MKTEEPNALFEGMLKQLHAKRSELQGELIECDQTISYITKLARKESGDFHTVKSEVCASPPITERTIFVQQPFATMSARWAILHLLDRITQISDVALTTMEITERLSENGKTTEAAKYSNAVSAVLSNMKSSRQEVDMVDGKWRITEKGRSAIEHIRFKNRSTIWSVPINWGPLGSVKAETPDAETSGVTN